MVYSVFQNLAGTVRSAFRVGKNGPSLRQGTGNPNTDQVTGVDGDVYIQNGTTQQFYQRRDGLWFAIGGEAFTRVSVTDTSYTIQATDYYIGVNYAGAVDLHLPPGAANKTFIIKDESGNASMANPINVIAYGDELIDGQAEMTIIAGFTSITIAFGNGWHMI